MEQGQSGKFNQIGAGAGESGHELPDGGPAGATNGPMVANQEPVAREIRPATRALLNTVVLKKISKKLSAKDMLGIRGTCSAWNKKFLPEIKKRHKPIELLNTDNLGQNETSRKGSNGNRKRCLKEFTECMGRTQENPFTKFHLWNPLADPEAQALLDFFSVCGLPIKNLTLNCKRNGPGLKVDWLRQLFQLAPQLEELYLEHPLLQLPTEGKAEQFQLDIELPKLKKIGLDRLDHRDVPRQLLNELVRCSVNLEYLDVGGYGNLCALAALQNFSQNLDKLRTLKIYGSNSDDLRIFGDLGTRKKTPLRLTKFVGDLKNDSPDEETVLMTKFLVSQASSLRTLDLYLDFTTYNSYPNFRIPKMEQLSKLKLAYWRNEEDECKLFYDGGTLAPAFPALKSFTWKTEYNLKELHQNSHDGVTQLYLPGKEAKHCLGMNFTYPALTHLSICMDNANVEEFAQLWGKWLNLQSLHLECSARDPARRPDHFSDLDELLTGLPTAALTDLKAELGFQNDWASLVVNLERIRQLMQKYKTRTGISDLPQLSQFTLELSSHCDYELADIGGYFGFAMASPTLQHISIRHSTNTQVRITPNCKGVIREALGPFAFINF